MPPTVLPIHDELWMFGSLDVQYDLLCDKLCCWTLEFDSFASSAARVHPLRRNLHLCPRSPHNHSR
jgi:hypothetical protein